MSVKLSAGEVALNVWSVYIDAEKGKRSFFFGIMWMRK